VTGVSNKPKILSKGTISYLLGAFFLLMSLGSFGSHGYIAGLLFFLAAIFTIPPAVNQLEKKINVSMPGIAQFFVVFLLVAIAFAAFPATPAATNNTSSNTERIAASPSSVNSSEAIAVPANQTPVTISNSTPNPANTSAAKKATKSVSTSTSTPTQTFDNKGKLDILTSPAGATITVDGVSEGVAPIEGLSVDAGTHYITVYLSGYDSQQEKVEVAKSETKELGYILVPESNDKSTVSTSTPEVTSTHTSQESSDSTTAKTTSQEASETPMQLSEKYKKDIIEVAEQYYGGKDVFVSYGNGVMVISYSIDSIPNPSDLYDDIEGMLIGGYYDAGLSGITDIHVVNVVVTTGSGRGLGVGNYYVAGERKTFDIDVSDCHP